MDPNLSNRDPTDSPSNDVLRFWEDPISDFALPYPLLDPSPSTRPLEHPHPLSSSTDSSFGTFGLTVGYNDHFSLDLCTKLVLEEGRHVNQSFFNEELATRDENLINTTPGKEVLDLSLIEDSSFGTFGPTVGYNDHFSLDLCTKLVLEEGRPVNQSFFNEELATRDENLINTTPGKEVLDLSLIEAPNEQFNCVHCQVLREVTHSNGMDIEKIEIHGTVGFLYHAIIETIQCEVNGSAVNIERQLVDFSKYSIEQVKQYLIQYGQVRAREGYTVIQDSLSAFYDCLCVQINGRGGNAIDTGMWGYSAGTSGGEASSNPSSGSIQPIEQSGPLEMGAANLQAGEAVVPVIVGSSSPARPHKSNIAAQRERTGKLKLVDLIDYFHLPIQTASKRLSICSTVLKKICRKNGLKRWPYRKIKSIDRNIRCLQQSLGATTGEEEKVSVEAEIDRLRQQRARICGGIAGEC